MNNKKNNSAKKRISIFEISILIISTIAFAYILAGSLPSVSATTPKTSFVKSSWKWIVKETKWFLKPETAWATAGHILGAAGVSAVVVYFIGLASGMDKQRALDLAGRTGISAGAGTLSGIIAASLIPGIGWAVAIGGLIGYLVYTLLQRERERRMDFMCKPWQAVAGGNDCELCNNGLFPCTEYQCKSLGVGCEIINKDTDNQKCIWLNSRDVSPPNITPSTSVLSEGYKYEPIPAVRGVEIKYTGSSDGCHPAYTPFKFGIELDKNGYCKLEFERTLNFSSMRFDFGGLNQYVKQHKQWMTFPGVVHLEEEAKRLGLSISVGKNYELYARCESANGVSNNEEFLFRFCIDDGPDETTPEMLGFDLDDKTPISWSNDSRREIRTILYTKEPAQCKWDWEDKDYEDMGNNLTSSRVSGIFNGQNSFTNLGRLTGLINEQENKFYFRCRDYFNNTNTQSKILTLIGTESLYISGAEPNSTTIKNGTSTIKITLTAETSAGANKGKSTCEYKEAQTGIYTTFSTTETYQHSTNIWLEQGNYTYDIRCYDVAGNSDTKQISFRVETDTTPPLVVRAFREAQNLKIITNENASCVYGTFSCEYDFDEGIAMNSNNKFHTIAWSPNRNFYIKCADEFGNQPLPNQCSIIVRAFEI